MRISAGRIVAAFAVACLACACAARAQTQADMNAEACGAFRAADEELSRVYARVRREYRADAGFLRKLRAAQRAWLAYRDAHLAARFPAENRRAAYGSVFPMCFCGVQEELTRARTEDLRTWVEGLGEGDVCAGSVKIRGEAGALSRPRRARAGRRATQLRGGGGGASK